MSVGEILGRQPTNVVGGNVTKLYKAVKENTLGVTREERFGSRAELQAAGLDGRYDELQAKLARGNIYDSNVVVAGLKLQSKQSALDDIRSVMTDFISSTSDASDAGGTKQQKADLALKKLAEILNRRENGVYIFGGKTANQQPITGDITKLDHTNFTDVTSNDLLVSVSDQISVDINQVTARDMAPLVKALNMYKNSGGQGNKQELNKAFDEAIKHQDYLQVQVGYALKHVESAKIENLAMISETQDILTNGDFSVNIVDRAEKMRGSMQSLMVNFSISSGIRNLFDKIMG